MHGYSSFTAPLTLLGFFLFLKKFSFNYLFMAVLGVHCCAQAFSTCKEQGLLSGHDAQASLYSGFSCCRTWACRLQLLWLMGAGSVIVAQGLSCPKPCGIFLDQGLNQWFLHWQEDSYSPHHQESPNLLFLTTHGRLQNQTHPPPTCFPSCLVHFLSYLCEKSESDPPPYPLPNPIHLEAVLQDG